MRTVTIALQLNDDLDPPTAAIVVTLDGREPIVRDAVPAAEWLAVVDAISVAAGADLRTPLRAVVARMLERVKADWTRAEEAQRAREQLLEQWTPVAETPTVPAP